MFLSPNQLKSYGYRIVLKLVMENIKTTLNFDEIPVTKDGYRHLDAVIYPDGSTSLKGLGKEPKEETTEEKKKAPVINLDELKLSKEVFKFRGRTITDENGNEILHSLEYVE